MRAALDDVSRGAGGELRGDPPPFASTESSAALAVNTFAVFADERHHDGLLKMTLAAPRFERRFPVNGVRAPVPPTLDVVFTEEERATVIESKFLEPWRDDAATSISTQYDTTAAAVSKSTVATLEGIRSGEIAYCALGAAQMLKHLLGVHSAISDGKLPGQCRLVLAYWEPADSAEHGSSIQQLKAEIEDLGARLSDQPVRVSGLSYRELWETWATSDAPGWLRAHAHLLQDRYAVRL